MQLPPVVVVVVGGIVVVVDGGLVVVGAGDLGGADVVVAVLALSPADAGVVAPVEGLAVVVVVVAMCPLTAGAVVVVVGDWIPTDAPSAAEVRAGVLPELATMARPAMTPTTTTPSISFVPTLIRRKSALTPAPLHVRSDRRPVVPLTGDYGHGPSRVQLRERAFNNSSEWPRRGKARSFPNLPNRPTFTPTSAPRSMRRS